MDKEWHICGFNINKKSFITYLCAYIVLLIVLCVYDATIGDVSWYGVIVGSGFLAGLILAVGLSKERGIDKDFPYTLIIWIFPFAIVGARLYYVLFRLEYYTDFISVISVWEGGLAIYGGIIAGAVALIIACLIHKKNILSVIDVVAPCLILGQAIGRWGNFVNQEAFGNLVTNKAIQWFPFAVYIESLGEWHLATFFYESLWCLLGCIALIFIIRKCKIKGIGLCSYGIIYGFERFFIEQLRTDSLYLGNVRISQYVSLGIFLSGVIGLVLLLILNRRKNEKNNII